MCAKDAGDAPGERRPVEGFLRGKPRWPRGEAEETGEEGGKGTAGARDRKPFGFYRPDPEDEERDRVARRLWKQVFG
jgi:ribosomal protein L15